MFQTPTAFDWTHFVVISTDMGVVKLTYNVEVLLRPQQAPQGRSVLLCMTPLPAQRRWL